MRWNERPGAGAEAAASAAQATADQALADASVVWVPLFIDAPSTPGVTRGSVPCPVNGHLTAIRVSANFTPDVDMVFASFVAGGLVTDGGFTLPTTYFPGNVVEVNPTTDNAVVDFVSAEALHNTGTNTVPGRVTVLFGFTRAAPP